MISITFRFRLGFDYLTGFLLLLAVHGAVAARSDAAATSDDARPRISQVRVGLAGHYKVGFWTPVHVEVEQIASLDDPRIEVAVEDSDSVTTTVTASLKPADFRGAPATTVAYTKPGRVGSPITVTLRDGKKRIDELRVHPSTTGAAAGDVVELGPIDELIVVLGADSQKSSEQWAMEAAGGQGVRRVAHVHSAADLPDAWYGYEAADLVILVASDSKIWSELAADTERFTAIARWVELGGRILILCSGENADELIAEGRPLAPLMPARLAEVVRLPDVGRLEHYASSETPITGSGPRTAILVPRLVDVEGQIELHAGRQPTDLPLVVRAARGFGEVAFAGVDFVRTPLAEWPGRAAFLQALVRPYSSEVATADAPQSFVARGYNDLSGALRQRLGRSFGGVRPITFPLVTVLAIAYLLVLGPLDYLIVHRWLGRPAAAWITFPLAVVLFGGAALALAEWRTGAGSLRVNRLELVDIDTERGLARGTFWATIYSPRADQLNLSLKVERPSNESDAMAEVLLSSWGLPGTGIGGMQARRTDLGVVDGGYHYSTDLDGMAKVPILTSSTKSLMARWTAPTEPLIEADLSDQDGLLVGSIENRTGRTLRNLRLLYNGWAYRLDNLATGRRVEVGDQSSLRRVKTVVAQDALGGVGPALSEGVVFEAERATNVELLRLMMFYQAAGGLGFAGLPSQYQAYCDMSRLLDVGRAILAAEVDTPGSLLVNSASGEPLGDEGDAAVIYRFVLPVRK